MEKNIKILVVLSQITPLFEGLTVIRLAFLADKYFTIHVDCSFRKLPDHIKNAVVARHSYNRSCDCVLEGHQVKIYHK